MLVVNTIFTLQSAADEEDQDDIDVSDFEKPHIFKVSMLDVPVFRVLWNLEHPTKYHTA